MANLISLTVQEMRGEALGTATAMGLNTESIISAVYEPGDTGDSIVTYADGQNGGRPIKYLVNDTLTNIAADSSHLWNVDLFEKNGVTYTTAANFVLNLERVIMMYKNDATADATAKWTVWYDTSNINYAGLDSNTVDILIVDFNQDFEADAFAMFLVGHVGNTIAGTDTGRIDPISLDVNGNAVAFPDLSNSMFVRAKNIMSAHQDSDTNTRIRLKTSKPGFAELIVDESLALNVARSAVTMEATS